MDIFVQRTFKTLTILFVFSFFFNLNNTAEAYNFSSDKDSLLAEMRSRGISPASAKVALIFNVVDQENLKKQTNLVQVKKDISYELSSSMQVADPAVSAEVLTINGLRYDEVRNNPTVRSEFAARNDANYVVFVSIANESNTLLVSYDMVSASGNTAAAFAARHPIETYSESNQGTAAYTAAPSTNRSYSPGSSTPVYSSGTRFMQLFPLGAYNRLTNDAWFYFQQSALVPSQTHSFEAAVWAKNLQGVDLPFRLLRYDLTYQRFQLGIQAYQTRESEYKVHSSYATVKVNLIDDTMFSIPLYLALGGKRGLYWRDENPELKYRNQKDIKEKNENLNTNSLFIALSYRVDAVGLLLNTYYDNLYFTLGSRLILHDYVRLLVDYQHLHIQSDVEKNDFAVFLELLPAESYLFYIGVQDATEQTLIGFKVSVF